MSRFLKRRLAGLEKQAATGLIGPQYPPIPSIAETKGWTLQQHQELYDSVRRGEYSLTPEDVERHRKALERSRALEEAGMSPADIYEQSCREAWDEVRREMGSE